MSEGRRLDPEQAAAERAARRRAADGASDAGEAAGAEPEGIETDAESVPRPPRRAPAPAIDTRRYRWSIGIFGLTLVVIFSVWSFVRNGVGSPGVAAGKPLHHFVAPLATSGIDKDANATPRCDPAHPNPLGLNVCGRQRLVLAFFVTDSLPCLRQVDALQTLAGTRAGRGLQFAAVAVHADRRSTLAQVRRRHWTIPVAYDRDGSIGELYGIQVCPIVELAGSTGVVVKRLIGERWNRVAALGPQLAVLRGR